MLERLGEPLLLRLQHLGDEILLPRQLGIGLAHQARELGHELVEKRLLLPELVAVANRTADDPAQHIAAAFVAGNHAVDDQERAGADMVGDDVERRRRQIARLRHGGGGPDQVLEQIDLIIAVHVLQHRGEALEAHAGIDAGLGQWRQPALRIAIELHEHQVPDLDVAVALRFGRARRSAGNTRPVIVEDLAARSARPGVGHLPKVVRRIRCALVVADAHDALARHADLVGPHAVGFVVGLVDGDPQLVRRQTVHAGQQFPRVSDRLALEVVAERPVAEHFEKCVMPGGVAHVLEVVVLAASAQAPLHVGGAHIASLVGAEKHILELDHAAVGEQQGRIVGRDERGRWNDRVPVGGEIVEELAADVVGFHRCSGGNTAAAQA